MAPELLLSAMVKIGCEMVSIVVYLSKRACK